MTAPMASLAVLAMLLSLGALASSRGALTPDGVTLTRLCDVESGLIRFSGSGHRLAFSWKDEVRVVLTDPAARAVDLRTVENPWGKRGGAQSIAFSPDDRLLAIAWVDGGVNVIELETGQVLLDGREAGLDHGLSVDFSGDGQWLAASTRVASHSCTVTRAESRWPISHMLRVFRCPGFELEERWILPSFAGRVRFFGSTLVASLEDHGEAVWTPEERETRVGPASRDRRCSLRRLAVARGSLTVSLGARRLVVESHGVRRPTEHFPLPEASPTAFDAGPSGRWMAVGFQSGSVWILDRPAGRFAQVRSPGAGPVRAVTIDHANHRLGLQDGSGRLAILSMPSPPLRARSRRAVGTRR